MSEVATLSISDRLGFDADELLARATNEAIEEAEGRLLEQIDPLEIECPLVHRFAPGVYMREVTMPAGTYVIGHEHLTEHGNVVLSGRALVSMNGEVAEVVAPQVFTSPAGLRKILIILEEMRFMTIHPNPADERDIDTLEAIFVRKSATYLRWERKRLLAQALKNP